MENGAPNTTPKPDAKVIIVTNLSRNVVEVHLQSIFSHYGKIAKIDLPLFGKSGQNRGKAALEFVDPPAAHTAASHMDGGQLDGQVLKVELSELPIRTRSRSPRPRRPRSFSRSRSPWWDGLRAWPADLALKELFRPFEPLEDALALALALTLCFVLIILAIQPKPLSVCFWQSWEEEPQP
ncbi:hypothetical protein PLICRDRAFT_96870 [Plicaturopsis crispa FD-325 SS-3]|nr:hypothetical protein PLICRDRAFT_96870 [Plicaturopsis crispa FD-325 SS-3]